MIMPYFTSFPVRQPAGLATEATENTVVSRVLSDSVTLADSPGVMRGMMDSCIATLTCNCSMSGISSST